MTKQQVTIRLDRKTLRKLRILAARRGISISGLLARQIEQLVGDGDDGDVESYEDGKRQSLAFLDQGFHLGGCILSSRDEWHER